jgi:hypothetical protein
MTRRQKTYNLLPMVLLLACQPLAIEQNQRLLAEVGPIKLTMEMAREAIPYVVWESDSVTAINRYVESWVSRQLMAQEADRLGLQQLQDVDGRLKRVRDDVLIEVLRERALNEISAEIQVTEEDILAYFEQNRSQFAFAERHVRIRHLMSGSLEKSIAAKRDIESGMPWERVVAQYASDKEAALASDAELKPASTQLLHVPPMMAYLPTLAMNTSSGIRQWGDEFHFIIITESFEAGSTPDVTWIKDRIFEWLLIDKRRKALQQYERSLFYEAESKGSLRIHPYP